MKFYSDITYNANTATDDRNTNVNTYENDNSIIWQCYNMTILRN